MTITINRPVATGAHDTGRVKAQVRARRDAALGRLNGGQRASGEASGLAGRAGGWARGSVSRTKPSRRAVQRRVPKPLEQLGPAPAVYYAIVVIVAAFVMLGLVMVLSATSANEVGGTENPYAIFTRQLVWAGFGLVGMGIAMSIPYQRWRSLVIIGAILAAGAMMLPFVPGVGATINDANSWVRFGSFGFQPSEILKLAAVAFLADFFARHRDRLHEPRYGIVPLTLVAMACSGVSFMQGDLGSAIVLGAVVLAVGVIAGIPLVHVSAVGVHGIGRRGAGDRVRSATVQPADRLPRHRGQQGAPRLAVVAGSAQHRQRRHDRIRHRRQPLEDGIPPARPQRLHLRRRRRRARVRRLVGRDRRVRAARVVRHPDRARRARPVRAGARRRDLGVVRRAGDRPHRRRRRADAGHRADAAVLLCRRHVAVRLDGRRRVAAQRRPPRRHHAAAPQPCREDQWRSPATQVVSAGPRSLDRSG